MSHHSEFELLSKLPIEILFTIITKYTGHYRIEKNNKKITLIPQLSEKKKKDIEKKFVKLFPVIKYNQYVMSVTIFIPIRFLCELDNVVYDDLFDEYGIWRGNQTNDIITGSGEIKKYYIVEKILNLAFGLGYNPVNTDFNSRSYTRELIKTSKGYFTISVVLGESKRDSYVRAYLYSII